MYINNLIIEVTRKCNFSCAHCLRGEAQKREIDFAIIDAILDNDIEYISTVTFTGGEPSLNVPAINYFVDRCKKKALMLEIFTLPQTAGRLPGAWNFYRPLLNYIVSVLIMRFPVSRSQIVTCTQASRTKKQRPGLNVCHSPGNVNP